MSINLNAESVKSEAQERIDVDQITPQQAQIIASLSDEVVEAAVNNAADDHFWSAYDNLRSEAIQALLSQHGTMEVFTPENPRHPELVLKLDPYTGANALSLIAQVDRLLRDSHEDEKQDFMREASRAQGFFELLALVYRWVTVDESAFTSEDED